VLDSGVRKTDGGGRYWPLNVPVVKERAPRRKGMAGSDPGASKQSTIGSRTKKMGYRGLAGGGGRVRRGEIISLRDHMRAAGEDTFLRNRRRIGAGGHPMGEQGTGGVSEHWFGQGRGLAELKKAKRMEIRVRYSNGL